MFNDANMEKIYNSKVAIFGIGGVGGYVAEALARSGVTTFYLYDPDVISITNLNRQIMATYKTLGKDKVTAMKERILSINPDAEVYTYKMFVDSNSIKDVTFDNVDYCIDTLDTISTKILLIKTCNELNIPLISCMGTGNHFDPSSFKVMDLAKTTYDPVAKVLRRELKKYNITHQKVVCSTEQPLNSVIEENGRHAPASNAFTPSSAGLLIASEVIKDIIK
jgi:tRNA A37 threonylcarbamoyladenosine dehydratase